MKSDEVYGRELFLFGYNSSTLNKNQLSKYILQGDKVSEVLTNYYDNEDLSVTERKDKDLPTFCNKLKLLSYILLQQSNKRLINKFDENAVIIPGNWSTGKVKYHGPIRGVVMRWILKKEGLAVYLPDEYETSSLYPSCEEGKLEKFKKVVNPRTYTKGKSLTIPVTVC